MPSPFGHLALTKLFPEPWDWPTWQEITGVQHGLFPADDSLLPEPWTRADANDISAYFDRYAAADEDDKQLLANSKKNNIPGLKKWRAWVSARYTKKWGVQAIIVRILEERNVHPLTIMLAEDPPRLDVWPEADTYIPSVLDAVGAALFGPEALNAHGLLRLHIRVPVRILIQRTWCNLRAVISRSRKRLEKLDVKATAAFQGERCVPLNIRLVSESLPQNSIRKSQRSRSLKQ